MLGPFWILYPLVEYTYHYIYKALLDGVEVLQCKFTVIKLAIKEYALYHILDMSLYPFGGWVFKHTGMKPQQHLQA
jgi:hypothetical protein